MNYAVDNRVIAQTTSLHDIIKPGPVEKGFYLLSGTRTMVPMVLDRLVDFLNIESHMSRPFQPNNNSKGISSEIGKLLWVDSGNSFDPYHMAQSAARRGLNPRRILRSIQVARPFTAFQFQQMLERVPNASIFKVSDESHSEGEMRQGRRVWRTPLVIISDLMSLFYDSEIQEGDVNRAFQEFMMRLSFLKKRAIVIGLQIRYPAPAHRTQFLPQILSCADRILSARELSLPAFPSQEFLPHSGVAARPSLSGILA